MVAINLWPSPLPNMGSLFDYVIVTERARLHSQARVMESVMQKPSLDQILATIPPPKRRTLDQKVSDIHLAEIARAVTDWRSVCPHLGITEGEEAAIEGNIDVRRLAVLRKWRSKYGPSATYRKLAECFYNADKLSMAEAVCQALTAPTSSVMGQLQGKSTASLSANDIADTEGTQQSLTISGTETTSQEDEHTNVYSKVIADLPVTEKSKGLEHKLFLETYDIQNEFNTLFTKVRLFLKTQGIGIDDFVLYLEKVPGYTTAMPLFSPKIPDLRKANNFTDIFRIVADHCSWFNHSFLDNVIETFCSDNREIKKAYKKYRTHLLKYCKHRVKEFPPKSRFGHGGKNDEEMFMKVDKKWEEIRIEQLEEVVTNLARIMKVSRPTLQLSSAEIGCVQMTLLVPNYILDAVFPLTTEQELSMRNMDVIDLQCGTYHFSYQVSREEKDKHDEEERRYLAACKRAMKKKGSLDQTAMHCVFMGIPRSGKSSLIQRLLGKRPSVMSASTGVAERVVRVEIRKSTVHVSGLTWCELEDVDEEALTLMHDVSKPEGVHFEKKAFSLSEFVRNIFTWTPRIRHHKPAASTSHSLQSPAEPQPPEEQSMKPPLEVFRDSFQKKKSKLKDLIDEPWTLYITDTGGQPEFQELLPILVSGPTLFFLVFRLDWQLNRRYQVEYITSEGKSIIPYEAGLTVQEMLLQSLATIASTSVSRMVGNERITINPDIFLVGTHKDCVSDDRLQEIDSALQAVVKGTEAYQEGMIQFASESHLILAVNNLSEGEEDVQQIRAAVERIGNQGDKYRVKTPFSWLMFSNIMQQMKSPILKYEHCFDVAQQCGIETRSEMNDALRFLHENVGVIRYYHDLHELHEFIIKDPQYVFDMITDLIVATFTFDRTAPALREQFTKRGIFPLDVFEKLSRSTELLPPSKLVALLQHLNIVALLKKDGVSSQYFIPCVLTHSEDSQTTVTSAACSGVPPLLVTFEYGYCPKGLFGALVVYLLQNKMKSDLEWRLELDEIFRDQICLSVGPFDSFQLKVLPAFLSIELCTSTGTSTRRLSLARVCCEVQRCISSGIGKVSETLHCSQKAAHSFGFFCPEKVDTDQLSHPATVNFHCGEPCNMKCSVHRRFDLPDGYQVWFGKGCSGLESRIATCTESYSGHHISPGTKPTLPELLRFTCTDKRVMNIPVEIGTKYVQFGTFLLDDRNGSRVKIMAHKHLNDAEQINTEILQEWLTGRGKQPVTWATLVEVLRDIELSTLAGEIEAVKCPAGLGDTS